MKRASPCVTLLHVLVTFGRRSTLSASTGTLLYFLLIQARARDRARGGRAPPPGPRAEDGGHIRRLMDTREGLLGLRCEAVGGGGGAAAAWRGGRRGARRRSGAASGEGCERHAIGSGSVAGWERRGRFSTNADAENFDPP